MGKQDDEDEAKSPGQRLAEKLLATKKNRWESAPPEELERVNAFGEEYKVFLNRGKTERECVGAVLESLQALGFQDLEKLMPGPGILTPGSKVYWNNRGKSLVCGITGKSPLSEGVNIIGAHVDAPRIDLKTNPLYEEGELAYLDTHYYGGIKHYQWTAIPLALHGTLIREDGVKQDICLGESEEDPVFTITDLLPHLAREQMQKKAAEFMSGEELNALAGSRPYKDGKVKEKIKLNLLHLLHERYGMVEQDFACAELELVPAFKARDLGFDRSMIGAYGHDDRSCVFAALSAILRLAQEAVPAKTLLGLFIDKEEIGSVGNTGAQSRMLENSVAYLLAKSNDSYSETLLRQCLARSAMLSADVNPAFDPNFDSLYDRKTASYFGKGLVLTKYTGSGGKSGGSDANAEYCAKIRDILNRNAVPWQYGDMGKVDKGGGGTIAKYAANLGMEVLDCGVPVLSMHSPFEVLSKIDLYTAYRGYLAFFREG
ncbi:MAG: aminopeptidase [Treponema sp.]|jgi:aspartyl aminopeptidase|nr:aminopeptidase [Treponema sp.]